MSLYNVSNRVCFNQEENDQVAKPLIGCTTSIASTFVKSKYSFHTYVSFCVNAGPKMLAKTFNDFSFFTTVKNVLEIFS